MFSHISPGLFDDYVVREAEHFEKLDRFVVYFGKDNLCPLVRSGVDHTQQDRYPDAVYYFGIREIEFQFPATCGDPAAAFVFDLLSA
jgi:hypothetical protein